MNNRVTLKDIARETGFHVTTVSGVLRGKANFAKETVKTIRDAAQRMGYSPDPMLTALAAYRSESQTPGRGSTLAFVGLAAKDRLTDWGFELVMPGIQSAASQRGFSVEFFNATDKGMSWERLGEILFNRGIKGVIFAAGPDPDMKIPESFPFHRFSVVALEDCIVQPAAIHRVMNHRSRNVVLAVERCIQAGYRRLALATFADREERQHRAETGSFLGALTHFGVTNDFPVFCPKKLVKDEMLAWYERYQPDAVICSHHSLADCLMAEPSVGVPDKTAVVHYHVVREDEPYSGIRTQLDYVGGSAVDMVIAMINRGETGLPDTGLYLQVPGVWHPGVTLIEALVNP